MGLPHQRWPTRGRDAADRSRATLVVRHPLVPIALALIAGILGHDYLPVAAGVYLITAICLTIATLLARHAGVASACLLLAAGALGVASAQSAHYGYAAGDVALYAGDEPRLADIEGTLVDDPRLMRGSDDVRPMPPRMVALLDVSRVRTHDGWAASSGRALVQIATPDPRLRGGDAVRLFGWLERPGPAVNPGQFDYANYYRGQRVPASLRVDGPGNVEVVAIAGFSPVRSYRSLVRDAFDSGFTADQREAASLLRLMLLGDRDPAMNDAREPFRASGTSHFLAVSGLHVGVIGGLAFAVVRLLGVGQRGAVAVTATVVALYAVAADPSPPVLRATLLAASFSCGVLLGRRAAGLQLLALAAIVLLALSPLDLYRAGFQLSFVTVTGLMLLGGGVRRMLESVATRGEVDAPVARGDQRLVRLAARLDARIIAGIAAAVVAWAASMPLVALHFGTFHAWAIPASLAASPTVAAALVAGVFKIALTLAIPEAATLWADLAMLPVGWMQAIVAWFAALPAADVPLPRPSWLLVSTIYAALALAWLTTRDRRPGHWRIPASVTWLARAPAFGLALAVFVLPTAGRPGGAADPLRVTLLAVGAGQCAAIELPGGGVTLIDAGSSSLGRPWAACVGPFLRSRGHAAVDRLVLSHANADHYNAVGDVAARYGPAGVVTGPTFADDAEGEAAGRTLLADLRRLDLPVTIATAGDVVPLSSTTSLRVLWPPADAGDLSANDASLVVRLEHAGRRVLFTGDVQRDAMAALLDLAASDSDLLRADVLVAPHHGSTESTTAAFVAAVDPGHVISSDSRRLSQKQLALPTRLGNRPLSRTGEDGAITVTVDAGGELSVSTFLDADRATLVYPE